MTNKYLLKMADGTEVENIKELREHFDLISVMEHFTSGKLLEWLNGLFYEEKAEMLRSVDSSMDDYEELICQILRVPYSLEEAVQCFEEGAANGNAEAQFHLGCFYMFGDGVELDEKRGA